jgi:hypothetical protein
LQSIDSLPPAADQFHRLLALDYLRSEQRLIDAVLATTTTTTDG